MSSNQQSSQDKSLKSKGLGDEAQHVRAKTQEQLQAIRDKLHGTNKDVKQNGPTGDFATGLGAQDQPTTDVGGGLGGADAHDRDFEGGFGGQEDLEDRYATTSGEH